MWKLMVSCMLTSQPMTSVVSTAPLRSRRRRRLVLLSGVNLTGAQGSHHSSAPPLIGWEAALSPSLPSQHKNTGSTAGSLSISSSLPTLQQLFVLQPMAGAHYTLFRKNIDNTSSHSLETVPNNLDSLIQKAMWRQPSFSGIWELKNFNLLTNCGF